jgi:hypothetical protein
MKIATIAWTGVTLLAMAQAAEAAPPKVSGKYALMIFTQCEARFTTTTDTYRLGTGATAPAVKSVNPFNNGELNMGVGTITFQVTTPASSGTASFEAFLVSGGSLRVNTTGEAMATHTEAPPAGPFSFTDTTFTFTPGGEPAMTWTIRPGNIVSGVARTLHMVRRENARCVNAVRATKQ